MPRKQKPAELREQAIILAADDNQSAAARAIGAHPSTVSRWMSATDPATLQRYAHAKRAKALTVVLKHTEDRLTELMHDIGAAGMDPAMAKAVQARATALGILDDHYGGRQPAGSQGRFGSASDLLNGWTEHDRVTLERIERVTLHHDQPQSPGQPG